MVDEQHIELLDDLLAPIPRKAILPAVEAALGVQRKQAEAMVHAEAAARQLGRSVLSTR